MLLWGNQLLRDGLVEQIGRLQIGRLQIGRLQIGRLHKGDHCCLVYDSPAEQLATTIPFFKDGLARGERCLYIADDLTVEEVAAGLFASGIDVGGEGRAGRLNLLTKHETYLKDGAFDPDQMIGFLLRTVQDATTQGFTGLRAAGEMTWALGTEPGCEKLGEYETRLKGFFATQPCLAICQYSRRRFTAQALLDALPAHPLCIVHDELWANDSEQLAELPALPGLVASLKMRALSEALEHAFASRHTFAAMAGHELRTPLTSLNLQLFRATRDARRLNTPPQIVDAIDAISSNVADLIDLAERLAEVAAFHDRPLDLEPSAMDLSALVRRSVSQLADAATRAQCVIDVDASGAVIGRWDSRWLTRLVKNLLGNCFRYAQGSSIRITVRATDSSASIVVADEGIGVVQQDRDRIFGLFQRAVSDSNYSGLGVGLWMVRRIAEAHGGTVLVRSAPSEGSTFIVELPLAR